MNQYGGGNYNPYSTTSYGSNGPAGGGGFYNQSNGGAGGAGFDEGGGAAGGGFGSPGSASKVSFSRAFLTNSVLAATRYVLLPLSKSSRLSKLIPMLNFASMVLRLARYTFSSVAAQAHADR